MNPPATAPDESTPQPMAGGAGARFRVAIRADRETLLSLATAVLAGTLEPEVEGPWRLLEGLAPPVADDAGALAPTGTPWLLDAVSREARPLLIRALAGRCGVVWRQVDDTAPAISADARRAPPLPLEAFLLAIPGAINGATNSASHDTPEPPAGRPALLAFRQAHAAEDFVARLAMLGDTAQIESTRLGQAAGPWPDRAPAVWVRVAEPPAYLIGLVRDTTPDDDLRVYGQIGEPAVWLAWRQELVLGRDRDLAALAGEPGEAVLVGFGAPPYRVDLSGFASLGTLLAPTSLARQRLAPVVAASSPSRIELELRPAPDSAARAPSLWALTARALGEEQREWLMRLTPRERRKLLVCATRPTDAPHESPAPVTCWFRERLRGTAAGLAPGQPFAAIPGTDVFLPSGWTLVPQVTPARLSRLVFGDDPPVERDALAVLVPPAGLCDPPPPGVSLDASAAPPVRGTVARAPASAWDVPVASGPTAGVATTRPASAWQVVILNAGAFGEFERLARVLLDGERSRLLALVRETPL